MNVIYMVIFKNVSLLEPRGAGFRRLGSILNLCSCVRFTFPKVIIIILAKIPPRVSTGVEVIPHVVTRK
jgi:hypothetical protein